ncbi:SRPBCC domain-containing protein [Treponema zuelzerae]|uniref:SRPBCC domain-containing protein n=1 Tax=Teretinema zuelzerae TaxID=156 RepID=A0AAE3EFI3_9SPIR|nr:SRPBCC domain-containing protein [Teretinema zuelzerae]MCD1653552.1 SRPBCC domain-containing protein [Teretinema zuelzerae]
MHKKVIVEITTYKSIYDAWNVFINPDYITQWNYASDSWCCPTAINDFVIHGTFSYLMQSKDKKHGFTFSGKYISIIEQREIVYELDDGRIVQVDFIQEGDKVIVRETFDAEKSNPIEIQRTGWQSILNRYKMVLERM